MKKNLFVSISLAALFFVAACQQKPSPGVQDSYAGMQDCVADWTSSDLCRIEGTSRETSHVWGPRYLEIERALLVRQDESMSRRMATRPGVAASPAVGRAAGQSASKKP